jgi:hypothetical protein
VAEGAGGGGAVADQTKERERPSASWTDKRAGTAGEVTVKPDGTRVTTVDEYDPQTGERIGGRQTYTRPGEAAQPADSTYTNPDGTVTEVVRYPDGTVSRATFDANGKLLSSEYIEPEKR